MLILTIDCHRVCPGNHIERHAGTMNTCVNLKELEVIFDKCAGIEDPEDPRNYTSPTHLFFLCFSWVQVD